jgi:serine phosphatase RsbU (regulator of sigma subunit)
MPWLVAIDGALAGSRFPLNAPCLVGRGPYNHIVLDDSRVSRQHAKISPELDSFMLYDLHSANGTFVNNLLVRRHTLVKDDVVRFGGTSFRYEIDAANQVRLPSVRQQYRDEDTTIGGSTLAPNEAFTDGGVAVGQLVEMEDADRKLRILYRFIRSICSTLETDELLDRVVRNLFEIFPSARNVAIYLRAPDSGKMMLRISRARPGGSGSYVVTPATAFAVAAREGTPSAVPAVGQAIPRMQAPMMYRDIAQGVLSVRGSDRHPFGKEDLALLNALAAQAQMALQNVRLHAESLQRQRIELDLSLAVEIQRSLLPAQMPVDPRIEFATEYRPAFAVGGDFYDAFWIGKTQIGVFIGDVSGKGIAAALLMARISSDLRLASLAEKDPGRTLAAVNRAVLARGRDDVFVTALFCIIDVATSEVTLANAGHPPPLLCRRNGKVERADQVAGPPIGVFPDAQYELHRFLLGPGEAVLLYTDGIYEATNAAGQQFGLERVEESLGEGLAPASAIASRVLRRVRDHVGRSPWVDDVAMVVFEMIGPHIESEKHSFRDDPTPVH